MTISFQRIARRCICCNGESLAASPAVLMPFVANRVFGWKPVEITAEWGLNDLRPGMAYPLCNSVQCQDCGALFMDIRFDDEELARLYRDYRGEDYSATRDRFEPGYRARNIALLEPAPHLAQVEDMIAARIGVPDRVLDWGGDTGLNTPFRGRCRVHHVFDISGKPVVEGAVSVGIDVVKATDYDLVTLSCVLEHVPFPRDFLANIREVIGKGVLYIEVPHEQLVRENPANLDLHALKRHWHEHINFFTETALQALLAGSGFSLMHLGRTFVSIGGKDAHCLSLLCRPT